MELTELEKAAIECFESIDGCGRHGDYGFIVAAMFRRYEAEVKRLEEVEDGLSEKPWGRFRSK